MTATDTLANLGRILPRLTPEQMESVYMIAQCFDKKNKEREDSHADT